MRSYSISKLQRLVTASLRLWQPQMRSKRAITFRFFHNSFKTGQTDNFMLGYFHAASWFYTAYCQMAERH